MFTAYNENNLSPLHIIIDDQPNRIIQIVFYILREEYVYNNKIPHEQNETYRKIRLIIANRHKFYDDY